VTVAERLDRAIAAAPRPLPALRQALALAQGIEDADALAAEMYPDAEAVAAEMEPSYDVDALEAERYRGPLRLRGYREGLRR
jgi:hypothetical protein